MEKTDMPVAKPASPIYRDYIKRVIDLTIAVPVFVVAAIPMALVAVAIKLDSRGPVFFRQERIGRNQRVFGMMKFRSMVVNAEHIGSGV